MKYLKVTNVPLKIMAKSKYYSYNGQIAWEACGFDPILVSIKAIQYIDSNQNMIQYIPISDETKFNTIWSELEHEGDYLGEGYSMELLDDPDGTLYTQWKSESNGN